MAAIVGIGSGHNDAFNVGLEITLRLLKSDISNTASCS